MENERMPSSGRLKEIEMEILILGQQTVNNFIRMGELLHKAKEDFFSENKVGWEKWCENNCMIGYRTVKRLIRIYEKFDNRDQIAQGMSIRALDVLSRFDDDDILEMKENGVIVDGKLKQLNELTQKEIEILDRENRRLKEGYESTIKDLKLERDRDIEMFKKQLSVAKEEGRKEVLNSEISKIRKNEIDRLETEYLMKKKSLNDEYRNKQELLEKDRKLIATRIEDVTIRESNLSNYDIKLSKLKKDEQEILNQIEKLKSDYGVAKSGSGYILEIKEFLKSSELIISDMKRINSNHYSSTFLNDKDILPYIEFTLKQLEEEIIIMSKKINKDISIIDADFK